MLCWQASRPLWHFWCWTHRVFSGWPRVRFNIKRTLKGSPLLARYFLTSGTKHWWNQSRKKCSHCPGLLVTQSKIGSWCLSFPFKTQGLVWEIRAVWSQTQLHFHKTIVYPLLSRILVITSLPYLQMFFVAFFFFLIQNRALSSESKIFSGRYSFLSMIFLMSLETHLNSSFGWKKLLLLLSWYLLSQTSKIIKPSFAGIKFSNVHSFTLALSCLIL